jgi:hypothetical protein
VPRRPPVALALTALLLTACSSGGPVSVRPGGAELILPGTCSELHGHLPERLPQELPRRETEPASTSTAAWGDPAITLRCGVAQGSSRDEPYVFNGVGWRMHDTGGARRWTTTGLRVNVEVLVPDRYSSQAEILGSLSKVLLTDLGR